MKQGVGRISAFIVAGLCLCGAVAFADGPVFQPHVEAEIVAETTSLKPGTELRVGLRLRMEFGWHVYWKNPGDSGLAPTIAWELPEGFEAGPIEWPAPHRLPLGPLMNFGYEDELLLPVRLKVPANFDAKQVTLSAKSDWLVCADVCVPGKAKLELTLPVRDAEPEADTRWKELFRQSDAAQPRPLPPDAASATREGGSVVLRIDGAAVPQEAFFFPADEQVLDNPAAQPLAKEGSGFALTLTPAEGREKQIDRLRGVLTVVSGASSEAFFIDVAVGGGGTVAGRADKESFSLPLALLFAFLGGLILNLMPCVFPVLSIKVLGFVKQAGEDPVLVRRHSYAFSAGVLVSFWALAIVLIALRAVGEERGWGFQLQEPAFVAAMAILIFLVGLNLAGVFEIGLGVMALAGEADQKAAKSGYLASFSTGVLATAIATPCTAPFMGPAVGYALTLSAVVALLVFTSLGLGMAAPYVVLSIFPGWLKRMPKPGPWMETFKQFMAFPLFATAIWLAWVFGTQTGVDRMLALLLGLLLAGMAAWAFGRWRGWISRVAAVLLLLGGVALALREPPEGLHWEPYNAGRLAALQAEERVIFVDFTADWCLTCKFNERTIIETETVEAVFQKMDVALLKADWTKRDATITRALAEFDRSSVPLYVVYGPGTDEPIVLPTVITPDLVVEAVKKAAP